MTKISVSFLVFPLLLFVLVVPEIKAEEEPKLCEKPSRTIWFGKCEDKNCDNRCKFWERAVRGACQVREAKASTACFCFYECSKDKSPQPPSDGGSPPPSEGDSQPPPADGGSPPPPADGGSPPPPDDGGSSPPHPADGGSPPPPDDGGSQPPPAMLRKSKIKVIA